jgi:hypothetical protein
MEDGNGDFVKLYTFDASTSAHQLAMDEIINKMQLLYEEYLEYQKRIEPYIVKNKDEMKQYFHLKDDDIGTINGYTGPIMRMETQVDSGDKVTYGYCPLPTQEFLDFLGLDSTKFRILLFNSNLLGLENNQSINKPIYPKISDFGNLNNSLSSDLEKSEIIMSIRRYIHGLTYGEIEWFHDSCVFIESVRANTQRFYLFSSQGTSFNHFLLECKNRFDDEDQFINKWIKEFEIGDGIDLRSELIAGTGTQINIKRGNESINIVDLGYGVTQLLALLLRILDAAHLTTYNEGDYTIIIIEEPETNLHPKFQSQLADLFIDVYKKFGGVRFIVETHSEYLIRKLQFLTVNQDIEPEDIVIHYIGSPDATQRKPNEKQVKTIHINSNGQLSEPFGSGFTDESLKWLKEMFRLSN